MNQPKISAQKILKSDNEWLKNVTINMDGYDLLYYILRQSTYDMLIRIAKWKNLRRDEIIIFIKKYHLPLYYTPNIKKNDISIVDNLSEMSDNDEFIYEDSDD